MDGFFAIRWILKYGFAGSIVLGVLAAVIFGFWLWPLMQWISILPALLGGGLVFLICKSYTEILAIVSQMGH